MYRIVTRRIWNQVGETSGRRALYLKKIANLQKNEGMYRYLDVGCGSGENALCFGNDFKEIHCLDVNLNEELLKKRRSIFLYVGSAEALPFRDNSFDAVSIISVIEHLQNKLAAIREAHRVLRPRGIMILQVPNRYFPIELHTGLPLLYYVPRRFRHWLLRKMGYEHVADVINIEIPSKNWLIKAIESTGDYEIHISKVIYPSDLILPSFRIFYYLLKALLILHLVPFGWLFVLTKKVEND